MPRKKKASTATTAAAPAQPARVTRNHSKAADTSDSQTASTPIPEKIKPTRGRKRAADPITNLDGDDVTFKTSAPQKKPKNAQEQAKLQESSHQRSSPELGDTQDQVETQENSQCPSPELEDAQVVKQGSKVPLDDTCPLIQFEVYIDDDGLIFDAALNQTNAGANNNKFYRVQLLRNISGEYLTWTRWGRVGELGQGAILGDGSLGDALMFFNKKFKDKSGLKWQDRNAAPKPGKYTFVERSYVLESDDEEDVKPVEVKSEGEDQLPQSRLVPEVQDLMELIFNQQYFANAMSAMNYDVKKLPLGKLSKNTLTRGFQALKDLSALLDDPLLASSQYDTSFATAIENLSNTYFSLIPHAFGRNRPPVIGDQGLLKREIELLESLGDMKAAADLLKAKSVDKEKLHLLDRQFQGLGLEEMTPLNHSSSEFLELKSYLMDTRGSTHNASYQIDQIFRIERNGEKDRFESSHFAGPARDRRLLWHGSRVTNFGGILSQGLRIAPPEAPASGYMFGKGIYLADMSSKSANYCCAFNSNGHALLLLCEAELGDPMQVLTNASYLADEDAKAKGMWSTWGQGLTGPTTWKDAGCLHPSLEGIKMPDTTDLPGHTGVANAYLQYNEYIAYNIAQVRLRYLIRIRM